MKKDRILVVDDSASVRLMLKDLFENAGYQVLEADDGIKCLELCRSWKPHLVMLDLKMPGMDGHLASIEIKYDDDLKDTQIVILTADKAEESRSESLGLGAESYVTKPFVNEDLLALVNGLLHPFPESSDQPDLDKA